MTPVELAELVRGYLRAELHAERRHEAIGLVVAELVAELQGDRHRRPLRELLPYGSRFNVDEGRQALAKAATHLDRSDPDRWSSL